MLDYLYALIIFASGYVLGWLLCFVSAKLATRRMKADYEMRLSGYRDTVTMLNKALHEVKQQRDAALRIVQAHDEMDKRISMN